MDKAQAKTNSLGAEIDLRLVNILNRLRALKNCAYSIEFQTARTEPKPDGQDKESENDLGLLTNTRNKLGDIQEEIEILEGLLERIERSLIIN